MAIISVSIKLLDESEEAFEVIELETAAILKEPPLNSIL